MVGGDRAVCALDGNPLWGLCCVEGLMALFLPVAYKKHQRFVVMCRHVVAGPSRSSKPILVSVCLAHLSPLLYCDTSPPWYVGGAHTRAFLVLTLGCCDTYALVPPQSSFLVGRYGGIENEIDNLDNHLQVPRGIGIGTSPCRGASNTSRQHATPDHVHLSYLARAESSDSRPGTVAPDRRVRVQVQFHRLGVVRRLPRPRSDNTP